jgi:phage-related protein
MTTRNIDGRDAKNPACFMDQGGAQRLSGVSEGAKSILLGALTIAAEGEKADIAKPLHGFGSGVLGFHSRIGGDAFRVVYVVQLAHAMQVIHAFHKKPKQGIKTPKQEIDLVKDRLKRFMEALR